MKFVYLRYTVEFKGKQPFTTVRKFDLIYKAEAHVKRLERINKMEIINGIHYSNFILYDEAKRIVKKYDK
jgi:hypothetical protein